MDILDEIRNLSTKVRIVEFSKDDVKGHFMDTEKFREVFDFSIRNFPFKLDDVKRIFEEVSKFGFVKEVLVDLEGYLIGFEDIYRTEAMLLKYGKVRAKQFPIKCLESVRNMVICLAICLSTCENIEYITYLKIFLRRGIEKLGIDESIIFPTKINLHDLVSKYISRIIKLRPLRLATEKDKISTLVKIIDDICEFHEVPGPLKMLAIELVYRYPSFVYDNSFSIIAKAKAFIYMAMELSCISYTYFLPLLQHDSPYTRSIDEVYEAIKKLRNVIEKEESNIYTQILKTCMERDSLPIPSKIYECLLYLSDYVNDIVKNVRKIIWENVRTWRSPFMKFLTTANIYSMLYFYCCRKTGLCLDEERYVKICLEEVKAKTIWECVKKTGKLSNDVVLKRLYKIYKTTPKVTQWLYDKALNYLNKLFEGFPELNPQS